MRSRKLLELLFYVLMGAFLLWWSTSSAGNLSALAIVGGVCFLLLAAWAAVSSARSKPGS